MEKPVPPRIYCIPAADAPVVAVFRRGPSNWAHVGRWDLAAGRYEPGAWLGGRLFPRRSDLSPDGQYLCYFAHKPSATWEHGEAYVAISKLPWLTALHSFPTCGTWTRGYCFTEAGEPAIPRVLRCRFHTACVPSRPSNSPMNGDAGGWRHRIRLRAIRRTCGMNVAMPACGSCSPMVLSSCVSKVSDGRAGHSVLGRRWMVCVSATRSNPTAILNCSTNCNGLIGAGRGTCLSRREPVSYKCVVLTVAVSISCRKWISPASNLIPPRRLPGRNAGSVASGRRQRRV